MTRLASCVVALTALGTLAAPRAPVVVLLPPEASDELRPLALLVAARASELVEASGGVSELHLKQALRVALDEGVVNADKGAETLRSVLGADRAVAFKLSGLGALDWTLYEGGKKPRSGKVALGATWSEALDKGAAPLAGLLLGRAPKKVAVQPASSSDEALKAVGRCYATVLRQPLSVDTPSVLEPAELETAVADCQKAQAADPKLTFATASLALAQAIVGSDAEAVKSLASLGDGADTLEVATLARFWLLTRYQSNEAGIAFLTDAAKRHPDELIARGYLGETQSAVGANDQAEATWKDYLSRAPASTWALGRLSKAVARQGRHDEALALAKKALDGAPTSRSARLEYGSRLIDAGQPAAAIPVLEPLAALSPAVGEDLLRLGWAYWLTGNVDAAGTAFQKALDIATAPGDYRTRGRAFYDLALVEAKRGRTDAARVSLRASVQTGLKLRTVDPLLLEVARELERADSVLDAGPGRRASVAPREVSLFPVDTFGDPDPAAKKPPAPAGLVLYRF